MNFSKDKHIIVPICLAIAGIIAYRSWYDMHPPPKPPPPLFDTYNLVRSDAAMKATTVEKENNLAVVVWAGDFQTGKDGKLALHETPVKPASLPQREVILLYTLDHVPKAIEAFAEMLTATSEKWKEQGDVINDLYLEAPDDKASLTALLDQSSDLREDLHKEYFLGLFAGSKTLDAVPDGQKKLADASKGVRTIVFNAKEALKPGETMADMIHRLDKGELPFILMVNKLPDFAELRQQLKPDPQRFVGFLLDAESPGKTAP